MTEPLQPLRDQPPEVLKRGWFTARSDIFSFGVMAWALCNGTQPWPELPPQQAAFMHCNGRRLPRVSRSGPGLRNDDLATMMEECWAEEPGERPAISDICDGLQQVRRVLGEMALRGGGGGGEGVYELGGVSEVTLEAL